MDKIVQILPLPYDLWQHLPRRLELRDSEPSRDVALEGVLHRPSFT
jgi:hypothetical protein